MKLILLLLLLLILLGLWEMDRHVRTRRRLRVRVHVNGSRGKSSVTRLIVAGLRGGGLRTAGKTTGSAARFLHPDGGESPVQRQGGPNIREQLAVFRRAVAEGAEAIVIECMAVRPDLQWVCEHRIVQATVGVITNVRPDHLEVMGPRLADVAVSLAGTVPRGGHLVAGDLEFAPYLKGRAVASGSGFTLAEPEDVPAEALAQLPYVEFAENLSVALAACVAAGVPRDRALAGMATVEPDVGALSRRRVCEAGKQIDFVNAFAANDPVSTARIWERLGLSAHPEQSIVLMNVRADRQRRSKDLAPLFGRELVAAHYVLIGQQTGVMADMLRRQGLPDRQVVDLGGWRPAATWDRLLELAPPRCTIVGIGNIHGGGDELLHHLETRGRGAEAAVCGRPDWEMS